MRKQDRRSVLKGIGAGVATVGLGAIGAHGATVGDPEGGHSGSRADVRIEMIQPLSGAFQAYGEIAMRGFYTYFGYRNGADTIPRRIDDEQVTFEVDGVTYTVELRDSLGDEQTATDLASDMADDATVLAGGTLSEVALSVANNVANQDGIPYMAGPAATPKLTNSSANCSRAVFRASETLSMDAITGANYIAEETDVDSVYIYYPDYDYGRTIKDNYQRILEDNGVTVSGLQPLPQGYSEDWPAQLDRAREANVDAVIGGFTVATLPAMLGTYLAGDYDFRLFSSWGTRISAGAYGATIQGVLGEGFTAADVRDAGLGPLTTRYHWNQYDNDIAQAANEIHRDAYGVNTDLFTSGMFAGASALVQAVEQSGSAKPADIVDEFHGMTVEDTLKGSNAYQFQEHNHQARSSMTVADVVPAEGSTYWDVPIQPSEPVYRLAGDSTTVSRENVDCDLSSVEHDTSSSQKPPETPGETPTETATPTRNDTQANDDEDDDDDAKAASETGALGPGVGVAGVLGGVGAAWLANRGSDDGEN